jgi:hypothetical protein
MKRGIILFRVFLLILLILEIRLILLSRPLVGNLDNLFLSGLPKSTVGWQPRQIDTLKATQIQLATNVSRET